MSLQKRHQQNYLSGIDTNSDNLETSKDHKCYACGQEIHDLWHNEIIKELTKKIAEAQKNLNETNTAIAVIEKHIEEIGDPGDKPETFYNSIDDAYHHQQSIRQTKTE